MKTRPTATILVLATMLATVAGAGLAAAQAPPRPVNPVCTVTAPVEEANPGQDLVCSASASAEANASAGGFPGACIQVYPYSEICDGAQVGAQAQAHGTLEAHVCVQVDFGGGACGPVFAYPQPVDLP